MGHIGKLGGCPGGGQVGPFPQQGLAADAGHGGFDGGVAQIELGLVEPGLGFIDRRLGGLDGPDGVVQVALAGGILFGQGLDPVQVGLGGPELGLPVFHFPLGGVHLGLEGLLVHLEHDLPFLHHFAFPVEDFFQESGHPGHDLHLVGARGLGHKFHGCRYGLRGYGQDRHLLGRRRGLRRFLLPAGHGNQKDKDPDSDRQRSRPAN